MISSIAVYCGSSSGFDPIYSLAAQELSSLLVKKNIHLINGAGSVGLMGVMANEMIRLGGKVTGVIPDFMIPWEVAHQGLDELIIVEDMQSRKQKMFELSDAFIALPGGFGTMEELFEILCWSQLSIHHKPVSLLNTNGFYDPLLRLFKQMVQEGFLKESNSELLIVEKTPEALLNALLDFKPNKEKKWL